MTLSPQLPMETLNQKTSDVSHSYREENTSLNAFFPQEGISTSVSTTATLKRIIWRPHNYRRATPIKERTNSTLKRIKALFPRCSIGKHNQLLHIKAYMLNITLMYGKKTLTAIYQQNVIGGHKETYLIERKSLEEINKVIDNKKEKIRKKLDHALKKFSRQFNIILPSVKPTWTGGEDFLKGENYCSQVPTECVVRDTDFKKIYKGKNIEFLTRKGEEPGAKLKRYIKNRLIEDISPQIASEIRFFNYNTSRLLAEFSAQINKHLAVLDDMSKTLKSIRNQNIQKKMGDYL